MDKSQKQIKKNGTSIFNYYWIYQALFMSSHFKKQYCIFTAHLIVGSVLFLYQFIKVMNLVICKIPVFWCSKVEVFTILGCCAALVGNWLPLADSILKAHAVKKRISTNSWTAWSLKMGTVCCLQMVTNYQPTPHDISDE